MIEIERIKNSIPILTLVEEVTELKKVGDHYIGKCINPDHKDQNPSMVIYPATESFNCFGCNKAGDIFNLYQMIKNVDFKTALKDLAKQAGIQLKPLSNTDRQQLLKCRAVRLILLDASIYYYKLLLEDKKALGYLKGRGITKETIDTFKLGYAPSIKRGASGGLNDFLKNLGHDSSHIFSTGVIKKDGKEYFSGFITIPNWKSGEIIYISGRRYPDIENKPKFLNLPGDKIPIEHLFLEDGLKGDVVFIAEGQFDTFILRQWGYSNVIGVLGASGFKEGWIKRLNHMKIVYLLWDADSAGIEGARNLANKLGENARIVILPKGMDVNDFSVENSREDFEVLLESAMTALEDEIHSIPAEIPKRNLTGKLTPILMKVSQLTDLENELYVDKIHDRFKVTKQTIRNQIKSIKKGSDAKIEKVEILESVKKIHPAQSYQTGIGYVTVGVDVRQTLRIKGKLKTMNSIAPYIISSQRTFARFDPESLYKQEGLCVDYASTPLFFGETRWSYQHIKDFLTGFIPNPLELYEEIHSILTEYVDFQEKTIPEVLTLWSIGTYVFKCFESYPYIHLSGERGSGKTKSATIAGNICFNSIFSPNISTSSIFRLIEANSGTIIIDEAEKTKGGRMQDYESLLNAGYKNGAFVFRCKPDTFEPQAFRVYSPKLIANIRGLDDVLESRCIQFTMIRTNDSAIANLEPTDKAEDWGYIRHLCYSFALTHFQEISKAYQNLDAYRNIKSLLGREGELWFPILAIASVFDSAGVSDLLERILEFATKKAEKAKQRGLDGWTTAVLISLCELSTDGTPFDESQTIITTCGEIAEEMKNHLEDENNAPSAQWVSHCLRRLGLDNPVGSTNGRRRHEIDIGKVELIIRRYNV